MTIPRLRPELQASPADDQGIKFFDVTDPRSGSKMRLYDFEWLLASQMDGKRPLSEIARWAKDALRTEITTGNLEQFARSMDELGFFERPAAAPMPSIEALSALSSSGLDEDAVEEVALDIDDASTIEQPMLPPAQTGSFGEDADTTVRAAMPGLLEATRERTAEVTKVTPPQEAPPTTFDRSPSIVESARAEEVAPKKSGAGSIIGLILVLLVVAAIVVYATVLAPSGAKVSIAVAKSGEVVRFYDGTSKLDAAPAKSLSFGEAGKVLDVVAVGTQVKAGMPLATLDTFAKVEKELTDVKDRLGFYQKQMDGASTDDAKKAAEAKVGEKQKLLAELESRAEKLRITASGPGTVDKVLVTAGGDAKADAPALQLDDKRVTATFKIPADSPIKVGETVSLQPAVGGAIFTGKAASVEAGTLLVEVAEAASGEVRLVKSRFPSVITLPASAIVQKNGGNVVYTFADGMLHEKHVTIADRSPSEVYVTAGVASGDSIVTDAASTFTDGQKAAIAQ